MSNELEIIKQTPSSSTETELNVGYKSKFNLMISCQC